MRRIIIFFYLFIITIVVGCRKENSSPGDGNKQIPFLDSALQFLKIKLSEADFAKLDLTSNKILNYRNKTIGIQIFENGTSHDKFLLLVKDSAKYIGNWVDLSGLASTGINNKDQVIILENFNREINTRLMVESNEVTQIIKSGSNMPALTLDPRHKNFTSSSQSGLNRAFKNQLAQVLPEVVVVCYACVPTVDYLSLFWLLAEDSYMDLYFSSGGGGGGNAGTGGGGGTAGGQSGNNVSSIPTFISPDKPISDLKQEFKCFTNDNSSTYSISVNVNQPEPNTREVFDAFADFPVGHTFLTFQQYHSDGSIITRNVGFYPKNYVKPGNTVDQSTFGDDSNTPFDASLKFKVSASEFTTVMNSLISQQSRSYDLNTFNCTNSPMDALKSIGINLPETKSMDLLFGGNDPADLGEDIKNLNLDQFSADNGNRSITRSVSNFNDQNPPARQGSCD